MTQENTLRTLKDFDDQHCSGCECMGDEGKTISEPLLRAEAIKWIKELELDYSEQPDGMTFESADSIAKISWIKHFFNITDEELK